MAQESRLVIVIDAKNAERNARNLGNELDSIEKKGILHQSPWMHYLLLHVNLLDTWLD